MKTLILIDVQNDFMPGGALSVPYGNEIVPVINEILPKFELVVASQDWHPASHKSFASNHKGKNVFETIDLNGLDQKLWPDHCVQNTSGAELHPKLDAGVIEAIFRKGMDPEIDSYSGFYDNGHKKSTGLAGYLREKGAKDLYFCGLAADICVYYSILDALEDGFQATLIEDASRPLDTEGFEALKAIIREKGADIITSHDLM